MMADNQNRPPDKYSYLPQHPPSLILGDAEFAIEVDRDPYERRRPRSDLPLGRSMRFWIGVILAMIALVLGVTAIFLG